MIFDIKMKGISDGQVTFLEPLLAPLSIEQFTLHEGTFMLRSLKHETRLGFGQGLYNKF